MIMIFASLIRCCDTDICLSGSVPVPFVSRYLPSDVAVIRKKGCQMRMDSTLVDFSDMKWVRGNISFLYNGNEKSKGLIMLDNQKQTFQRLTYEVSSIEPTALVILHEEYRKKETCLR